MRRRARARPRGFTLVELLVGLALLSLLALMSWQGLSALLRSQAQLQARGTALAGLQTTTAQWLLDLQQATATPYLNAMAWDGQQLRIVRRSLSEEALVVVAWGLRPAPGGGAAAAAPTGGMLRRWQSGPLRDRAALVEAWNEAAARLGDGPAVPGSSRSAPAAGTGAGAVSLLPVQAWELSFHQGVQWGRPPVVAAQVATVETQLLEPPTGVRLKLELPAADGLQGSLQLDWANPRQNRGRP